MASSADADKNVAILIQVTEALLQGEFDCTEAPVNAEGMLATLAQRINSILGNMRSVENPLSSAGEQAPLLVSTAESVEGLMAQATEVVLDKADKLIAIADKLEESFKAKRLSEAAMGDPLHGIRGAAFDIIASQSYQDVARQKMEAMVKDIQQIRQWLIESLIVLNIYRDTSPENIQKKTEMLREVNAPSTPEVLKQDLVDDLLAEFGF
ncbi:MAG: hypothetical protein M0017_10885 [Desulfobacteraceae bacterium]|nr:hypothetical protein [Desulfobacteraceae bacterium]